MSFCTIDGCGRPLYGRGWCSMHYKRWRRNGDPLAMHAATPPMDRFQRKVTVETGGCHLWTGSLVMGYGRFRINGETVGAHRWIYEQTIGPIPEGMSIDHLCHNSDLSCTDADECRHRRCVNPDHLEAVPIGENVARGGNGRKTHCKRGHEFTPENTYVQPSNGGRLCRICRRDVHGPRQIEAKRQKRLAEVR